MSTAVVAYRNLQTCFSLRRLAWLLGLVLIQGSLYSRASSGNPENPLPVGQNVEIALEDQKAFQFEMPRDQYAKFWLSSDVRVWVALEDPDGQERYRYLIGPVEKVPISIIAASEGLHSLLIFRNGEGKVQGRVTLRRQTVRPASEQDAHRAKGERLMLEAEELAASWSEGSYYEAIQKLSEATANLREASDRRGEMRALRRQGVLQSLVGDSEQAVEILSSSLELAREYGDLESEISTIFELARLRAYLGRNAEALRIAQYALQATEGLPESALRAQCLEAMGFVKNYGHHDEARVLLSKAQGLWRKLGNRHGQARTAVELYVAYFSLGEEQMARQSIEEALTLWQSLEYLPGVAKALQMLANHHSKLDDKEQALDLYFRARETLRKSYDPRTEARVLTGIGWIFLDSGDARNAKRHFSEAFEVNKKIGNLHGQANSLHSLGIANLDLGLTEPALQCFLESLTLTRAQQNPRFEGIILHFIGETYLKLNEPEEALPHFEKALQLNRENQESYTEADTLMQLGLIHQNLGQIDSALENFREALAICQKSGYRHRQAQVHFRLAQAHRSIEQLAEAHRQVELALQLVESVRSDFPGHSFRTSYFATVHHLYQLRIDLLVQEHLSEQTVGFDSLAFEASEEARARSLLDSLSEADVEIYQGVDPSLLEQEKELRASLNRVAEQKLYLPSDAEEKAVELDTEVERLTAEYTQLDALIRSRSPQYAALTRPAILSLKEVQNQLLDEETLLLEYQLGEKRSFLWIVGKSSHSLHILPPRAEIEKAVLEVLQLLRAREPRPGETTRERRLRIRDAERQYWTQAAVLSEVLLGRMDATSEHKRLLIVSDGVLQYVPFSALPMPGGGTSTNAEPLVMEYELVRLPSASILAALRKDATAQKRPAKALAVLADPVLQPDDPRLPNSAGAVGSPDQSRPSDETIRTSLHSSRFPRLPSTQYEAEAIVGLLPRDSFFKATGFDASREVATSEFLRDYGIIHFATHSILDQEHPGLSGVVLSMFDRNGNPVEGFLRLHDIYNLDLPVDMVVLSACESYLGKEFRGEGLVGLVRGFMYAGADRVVASLWKVDDLATKELMVRFYRALMVDGKAAVAALRDAQIQMLETPEWRSPFYWAAFIVQGDWMARGEPAGE